MKQKKQLLTGTFLLFAVFSLQAQKPDTAQFMVHYKFSHLKDTGNRVNPYTENMALFLGKNSSAYKSYDKQLEDALFKKQVQEQTANSPDGNIRVNRHSSASGLQYYQFPAKKKLTRKEQLFMNSYLIEESLPVIAWTISSDTASFGGLFCQKATAHFKGRDYTAWFCPDMPFHAGPWKLNGLPGVILDAYDAKKEVVFQFDGIEKVAARPHNDSSPGNNETQPDNGHRMIMIGGDDSDTDPSIIQLPSGAIPTTEKEFSKLQEAMRKDPNAFVQSQIAASGMNGQGNGPKMKMDVKAGPAPINNNPIELPEKQ
jgi:GLPGLI family protein